MSDFAQIPQNVAANNFRINGSRVGAKQSLSRTLEASAVALPALGAHMISASTTAAVSLVAVPGVNKLQLPIIPGALKNTMRNLIPPPQFARVGGLGKGLATLSKAILRV